jgi:hypothetical protein
MPSTGKKKTTMAKLARESRLRERRLEKQARKDARKQAAAYPPSPSSDPSTGGQQEPSWLPVGIAALSGVICPSGWARELGASQRIRD